MNEIINLRKIHLIETHKEFCKTRSYISWIYNNRFGIITQVDMLKKTEK
jgi:hypothetical protein